MDAQDPSMFGMFGITSSVMKLLCCVPVRDSNKLCEKHVLTLIITFSAAVMNGQDPNMFGMSSIANMFRDGTVVLCSF